LLSQATEVKQVKVPKWSWTSGLIKAANNLYILVTEGMKVKSGLVCADSEEQKKKYNYYSKNFLPAW